MNYMTYFEKLVQTLRDDSSYDTILKNIVNVFSPYYLCQHFIGDEAWKWGILSRLPPGKNDLNSTNNLSVIQDYDIIQCQLKFFPHFVMNILPSIHKKVVLITSQFEQQEFARNEFTDLVLNHPNVVLWISTNPIYEASEKYMPFPFGFSPFNLSVYTNILLNTEEITKTDEWTHMHLSPTNPCRDLLPKGEKYSEEEFYHNIQKSRFMISPIGDRDDCYRHYECIGLKTIPISNVSKYYADIFKEDMYYCDIQKMIEIIETNKIDYEYREPNRDLISYEYHKDRVYKRIQSLKVDR